MNCREFEELLDAIACAAAPPATLREAAAHARDCLGCRELESLARASLAPPDAPAPDLTRGVLSLTSGPACATAHVHLADLADGSLPAGVRELVISHLAGCPSCADLAATLSALSVELPCLAEIDPGEAFTRSVMRASLQGRALPAPLPRRGRFVSLAAWWSAAWSRPRFTWEAAYAGALVVWLLFGAGFSPLSGVPRRALELARVNPVQAIGERVEPASLGRQVWEATGADVMRKAEASTDRLADRGQLMKAASSSLARHGAEAIGSAFRGDLSGSAVRLKDVGQDLQGLWDGLWGRRPDHTRHEGQEA